jgi:PAS domain S-box-containing protein
MLAVPSTRVIIIKCRVLRSGERARGGGGQVAGSVNASRETAPVARFRGYLIALVAVSAAFALKATIARSVPAPYVLFYPAVFVAAGFGGIGPGVLATLASALLADYFFLDPVGRLAISRTADLLGLALFTAMGLSIAIGAEAYRRKSRSNRLLTGRDEVLRLERDQAQKLAAELKAVLQAVPAGVFITRDPDAHRVEGNPFGMKMLGLEANANASKTAPADEVPESIRFMRGGTEIPPAQLPIQMAVFGRREITGYEMDVVAQDGSTTHLLGNATPLKDAEGKTFGAVGAFVDVTETRRAQERLTALVSNSADVLVVIDGQARVNFVSPNAKSVVGLDVAQVEGEIGLGFIHPDDREQCLRVLAEILATPDATGRVEVRLLDGAGAWRVIEVTGRNLLHNPAVEGVVLNVRDVTIQRQTEEQLRHAQRMESVGRLAGGVAHDFNNLLTVIMAAVAEMRAAAEAKTPIDSDLVDDVDNATNRARDLTRQLLLFARKQIVAPVPLDLNDVVANNLNLLRRTLGDDVKFVVALHDGLGLTHCDPGQASQVLMNLAVNARDAMPGGGMITIETRNVDLSPADAAHDPELRSGSWVQLLVRDSGIGIPPEVRAHLFEPFFTTKPRGQGTGLGLATIHGIVAQSKGFITVRSDPGHGSAFEVYLPRADASVRLPGKSDAEKRPSPGTETVLVVDDEPSVLEAVGRTLRNAGYEVLMAREGRQALDLKAGDIRRLHLLVTDVVMPGLSGGEVAAGLRAFHRNLPVLYMSGFTDNAVTLDGLREPNTHFIGKPFAPEELLAKVRAVLVSAPRM